MRMKRLNKSIAFMLSCTLFMAQIPQMYVNAKEPEVVEEKVQEVVEDVNSSIDMQQTSLEENTDLNSDVNIKTEEEAKEDSKQEYSDETSDEDSNGDILDNSVTKETTTEPVTDDSNTDDSNTDDSNTDDSNTDDLNTDDSEQVNETVPNIGNLESQNQEILNEDSEIKEGILSEEVASLGVSKSDFVIEDGVLITYKGSAKNVAIPEGVIAIGDKAFNACYTVISVTIPSSVITIGNSAFAGTHLENITIPDSVTTIGDGAFAFTKLKSITIPESVKVIGTRLFSECYKLISVTLPSDLSEINEGMFDDCENLRSINIPETVTKIGACAFSNCLSLTDIDIPKGVTSIGDSAFESCILLSLAALPEGLVAMGKNAFMGVRIENLVIPSGITRIEDRTFSDCGISKLTIPEGVTYIGQQAFSGCQFRSLTFPKSLTYIGNNAFSGCNNLSEVNIAESSVETIGQYAFAYCKNLTKITIPNSVTSMGNSVFEECNNGQVYTKNIDGTPAYYNSYFKIYCNKNSYAYTYSKNNNIIAVTPEDSEVILLNSIVLSKSKVKLALNAKIKIVATTYPQEASNAKVIWSSSNEDIAIVSSEGVVTAKGEGITTITAMAEDESKIFASCEVNVPQNKSYKIKYKLNGGTNADSNPSYYASGMKLNLEDAKRKGYVFKGWYAEDKKISSISKSATGNITLNAKWEKIKVAKTFLKKVGGEYSSRIDITFDKVTGVDGYTVFYADNEKMENAKEQNVSAKKTTASIKYLSSNRTYYVTVKAYRIDSEGNKIYGKVNKTVKVVLTYKAYDSIIYKLNGGKNSDTNPEYYTKGVKLYLSDPTRKGYIFKGWYNGKKKVTSISSKTTGKITLNAKWEKVKVDKTTVVKVNNNKEKQILVSFDKVNGIDGYTAFYSEDKKLSNSIKQDITVKKKNVTIKNLEKNHTYYITVRAYKIDSTGNKVYGKSDRILKVKIKK